MSMRESVEEVRRVSRLVPPPGKHVNGKTKGVCDAKWDEVEEEESLRRL
jgi:hypothetical protein